MGSTTIRSLQLAPDELAALVHSLPDGLLVVLVARLVRELSDDGVALLESTAVPGLRNAPETVRSWLLTLSWRLSLADQEVLGLAILRLAAETALGVDEG